MMGVMDVYRHGYNNKHCSLWNSHGLVQFRHKRLGQDLEKKVVWVKISTLLRRENLHCHHNKHTVKVIKWSSLKETTMIIELKWEMNSGRTVLKSHVPLTFCQPTFTFVQGLITTAARGRSRCNKLLPLTTNEVVFFKGRTVS